MKSFHSCDEASHKGKTNTWFTPPEIIEPLGKFDLDPCTLHARPFNTAERHICYDKSECGLGVKWAGRVWLNPPYGDEIAIWLEKLAAHNNGIALVFARTETAWAQSAMRKAAAVNFIKGRISFLNHLGNRVSNAGTGSMLLAFGLFNARAIAKLPGVIFKS